MLVQHTTEDAHFSAIYRTMQFHLYATGWVHNILLQMIYEQLIHGLISSCSYYADALLYADASLRGSCRSYRVHRTHQYGSWWKLHHAITSHLSCTGFTGCLPTNGSYSRWPSCGSSACMARPLAACKNSWLCMTYYAYWGLQTRTCCLFYTSLQHCLIGLLVSCVHMYGTLCLPHTSASSTVTVFKMFSITSAMTFTYAI